MSNEMNDQLQRCRAVEARLSEYMDDDLDPGARAAIAAHLAACERCAETAAALEMVVQRARALPALQPARDLWAGIAQRIDAPVVPLRGAGALPRRGETTGRGTLASGVPASGALARGVGRWRARLSQLAAAAALVTVSAGVTYLATVATLGGRGGAGQTIAARPAPDASSSDASSPATSSPATSSPAAPAPSVPMRAGPTVAAPTSSDGGPRSGAAAARQMDAGTPSRPRLASTSTGNSASTERALGISGSYDVEIARLQRLLRQRRGTLDSGTVAVVERNLAIIDAAIAQSRAALASDPGSHFLAQQLGATLDKKVELLRTVALLPSRT